MKKIILLILPLILTACLDTTIKSAPSAVPAASHEQVQETEPESGAVFELPEPTPTDPTRCAVVSAIIAVNLRAEPNPRATIKTALLHGETVTIHKLTDGWYAVNTREGEGYVNASYLTESACKP